MNRSMLVASLCVVALAGCTRTVVREHVVEKEPVVQRETVIEHPAVTRETVIATPAPVAAPACTFGASVYSSGTLSCQAGYQYQCRDGVWERVAGSSC